MRTIAAPKKRLRAASPVHKPGETYLSRSELTEFREALVQKHNELLQDVARIRNDAWEMEANSHLYKHTQRTLAEVEDALRRIEAGSYGVCEGTEHRIGRARLRAIPWAQRCFECARK